MSTKPIRIIGGGLAGLSLGIGLRRRDVPVTLVESGKYPRHKVCGEFLSGLSKDILRELNLEEIFAGAMRHRSIVWKERDKVFRKDVLPDAAYGISRYELDLRLAEAFVSLGGSLETGSREPEGADDEGVVWAAGRKVENSDWIGLKAHFKDLALEGDLEMRLGEDAYLGASAVEDGWVNVCGLFKRRRGLETSRDTVLVDYARAAGMNAFADRLGEAECNRESVSSVAALQFGKVDRAWEGIRIGDAYAMMPPFTGNGMAMAMEGGLCAVEPLDRYAAGRIDWKAACRETHQVLNRHFQRRLNIALWIHANLYSRWGQRVFVGLSRARLLPFQWLYRSTRQSQ